ncbi:hypothetical protein HPG69_004168 [Diceros bicornis minor]|uniref:Uncharacterized protein n=1 Tax=Diceros bicornis minor TaxID=77932 RepID=A0A7J7E9X0_DICBM|nr:hypothetical protein HPG69_004168 [Diceros bicornis minor]
MLGNGFIVLVNCIDWVKSQKLSSAECILTSLAISRINTSNGFWIHVYKRYNRNSAWSSDVSKTLYLNSLIVFNLIYLHPLSSVPYLIVPFTSLFDET